LQSGFLTKELTVGRWTRRRRSRRHAKKLGYILRAVDEEEEVEAARKEARVYFA
jgi:hypothetical protein